MFKQNNGEINENVNGNSIDLSDNENLKSIETPVDNNDTLEKDSNKVVDPSEDKT